MASAVAEAGPAAAAEPVAQPSKRSAHELKDASLEAGRCTTSGQQWSSGALKLNLDGGSTLKIKHSWSRPGARAPQVLAGGQRLGLELSSPSWGLEWSSSNDVAVERKLSTRAGDLRIKQRIPRHKLYLVPSPEVKLLASPLSVSSWKLRDDLQISYDFQTSKGKIEEELVWNKKWKAKVTALPHEGLNGVQLALTAKGLGKPYASSLGLSYSYSGGPVLRHEASFGEDSLVKTKAEWKLAKQEARLQLQPKLLKDNDLRLSVTAIVKTDALEWSNTLLGIKYDL